MQQTSNKDLVIEGVLLTMFDGRTNLSVQVADEVNRSLVLRCIKQLFLEMFASVKHQVMGEPIIVYDSKSKGCSCLH